MESQISIIAAIGKNRELGKDNKLLWDIPEDLRRFRQLTSGHSIIMGRKTFESIGRVLPNRLNIVITRDKRQFLQSAEGLAHSETLKVVGSLEEGIAKARKSILSSLAEATSGVAKRGDLKEIASSQAPRNDNFVKDEIFIIGGGQIFEQAMDLADRLYLTIVDREFDADTFFPEYDAFSHIASENKGRYNGVKYRFLDLRKD